MHRIDLIAERTKVSTPTPTPTPTPAIANPGPLGLSAFALTTFVLSTVNAGLLSASKGSGLVVVDVVLGLALFYGGLAQFCAGMWEFRIANVFGATAFSSYGAFWMALGFASLPIFGGKSLVALAGAEAVGVFLLGWTIFTAMMLLVSFKVSVAHILLFLLLFFTFLLLTIGHLVAPEMTQYGGWLGLITALVAWYIALAVMLSATNSPIKLPILPLS